MKNEKAERSRLAKMLGTVPMLSHLEKKELEAVAAAGREVTFSAGKTILKEGEPGLAFLLVLDGKVEVRKGGKTVAALGRGDFFGEMTVIDDKPRSADVVAIEETKCFGMTAWAFAPVLRSHPDIALGIIRELVGRLRRLEGSPLS